VGVCIKKGVDEDIYTIRIIYYGSYSLLHNKNKPSLARILDPYCRMHKIQRTAGGEEGCEAKKNLNF
jgi:hypothetical protein